MINAPRPKSLPRRYFDNAATSFPKPPAVAQAMLRYMTDCGASARGAYAEARHAADLVWRCRQRIATLINAERPESIVFTLNATDSLNIAIKGVLRRALRLRRSIHVLTTVMEHNSVLRPLRALEELERDGAVEVQRLSVDPASGRLDPDDLRRALRSNTALVALIHASNMTGTLQPAAEVGAICREAAVPFLLDAAQSVGHIPADAAALNADLLAFPGHKGLLGPTGTGALYIRPGLENLMDTHREGGTGSTFEHDAQPDAMPDRFESGSHNVAGIVGLSEGVAWILEQTPQRIWEHEKSLMRELLRAVGPDNAPPGLTLLGPQDMRHRVGVFSFVHDSISPHELGAALESGFGILTRAGLHCAPLAHRAFGTAPETRGGAGAVRLSLGPFLTLDDVRAASQAMTQICLEAAAV